MSIFISQLAKFLNYFWPVWHCLANFPAVPSVLNRRKIENWCVSQYLENFSVWKVHIWRTWGHYPDIQFNNLTIQLYSFKYILMYLMLLFFVFINKNYYYYYTILPGNWATCNIEYARFELTNKVKICTCSEHVTFEITNSLRSMELWNWNS